MKLDLGHGLLMRVLVPEDSALLVEGTSGETAAALWGPRPAGPYSLGDAQAALAEWDRAAGGQFSVGVLSGERLLGPRLLGSGQRLLGSGPRLLGAVGLMPDQPASAELAYWVRPERRGQGLGARAVQATTRWAHDSLGIGRIWLEIRPGNEPSLRLARRAGYHFEQRLARHCRDWSCEDAELDSWHDCLIWAHLSDQHFPGDREREAGRGNGCHLLTQRCGSK